MSSNNKIEEQKNAQNQGAKSLIDENSFSILGINVLSYADKLVGSKIVSTFPPTKDCNSCTIEFSVIPSKAIFFLSFYKMFLL